MPRRADGLTAILAALLAALLWALIWQFPASHRVDIGGADAAYVQGLGEREQPDAPNAAEHPYLEGASVRRLGDQAALLWPQAGTPASLALRWRSIGSAPISVTLLLNGGQALEPQMVYPTWSVARVPISGRQTKPSGDWFVAFRTAQPNEIVLDQAIYNVKRLSGLPAPVPWAAVVLSAAGVAVLLPRRWRWWRSIGAAAGVVALMALLYRWQPPLIPYPVRRLPLGLVAVTGAALLVRWSARVRWTQAERWLVGGGLLLWLGWMWRIQTQHLVLSLPGVEADFSVFARRSADWNEVFRADGFYQLGYPLLLRTARWFTHDNPFVAAQIIALLSSAVLLLATWALARARWGRAAGILTLLIAACNPLTVQYTLYLGTDMPFAAACAVALWAMLRHPVPSRTDWLVAGVAAGMAWTIRHPGLVLLVWALGVHGAKYIAHRREGRRETSEGRRQKSEDGSVNAAIHHWLPRLAPIAYLLIGFLLAGGAQLVVNTWQTGNPIYSQQAKNVWLAVYGNTEFRRWDEERNDVSLFAVVQRDPVRVASNWCNNLVAFTGTGGARAAEFERAVQLRLLAWPFNLLALAGLGRWLVRWRREPAGVALIGWSVLYVAGVAIGFLLPRFVLPLVPVYATAAALVVRDGVRWLRRRWHWNTARVLVATVLIVLLLTIGQAQAGAQVVLDNQIATERAIAQAVGHVPADQPIAAQVEPRTAIAKYSAVAERMTNIDGEIPTIYHWAVIEGTAPADWQLVAWSGTLGLYRR